MHLDNTRLSEVQLSVMESVTLSMSSLFGL